MVEEITSNFAEMLPESILATLLGFIASQKI